MIQTKLTAKVIELVSIASGKYGFLDEQEVILELLGGTRITAYDWNFLLTKEIEKYGFKGLIPAKEFEGKKILLKIYISCPIVKKITLEEKKIVLKRYNQTSILYEKNNREAGSTHPAPTPGCYNFYGKVLKIASDKKGKQGSLILDIGVGDIEVGLDRAEYKYEKFSVGDYVEVTNGWIELKEISDGES